MSAIRFLAGLLITASLLLAAPAALAQAGNRPVVTEALRDEFRRGFIEGSGGMMRYLIEDYPAEYRAFETDLITDLLAGKTADQVRPKVISFMGVMTPKLYEGIYDAPDKEIIAWTTAQLALGKILAAYDPMRCRRVMESDDWAGVHDSLKSDPRSSEAVKRFVHSALEAARAGRRTPVKRTRVSDDELRPIGQAFLAAKGDQVWLDSIGTARINSLTDEQRCRNSIIWSETILRQPAPLAARTMLTD